MIPVPTYEFRCRECGGTFVEQRPMAASNDAATCPAGHDDTVRLLSVSGAIVGVASRPSAAASAPTPPGGGCCGGGCCG
jgi:putative FmdB family regulatory protein